MGKKIRKVRVIQEKETNKKGGKKRGLQLEKSIRGGSHFTNMHGRKLNCKGTGASLKTVVALLSHIVGGKREKKNGAPRKDKDWGKK